MSGSTIAIIYGVVLVLFFILLVVLTVTLIVSKSKKRDDEDDIDEEYEEYEEYDLFSDDAKTKKEWYEEEASGDDNSYTDSAFAQEDSVFATESQTVNVDVEDSAFTEPVQQIPLEKTSQEVSPSQTEIPVVDSTFADSAFAEPAQEVPTEDSAFSIPTFDEALINDNIDASVKEAVAIGEAVAEHRPTVESYKAPTHKKQSRSNVPSTDDFYWYNKMDVAEKPSYKTEEMYHHHFNIAKDCIEDLLIEMYDCALVRTEEIKYIAYGIEPRAVSMKEILTSGNRNYTTQVRIKEPSTQDLVKIYEKWCGYVDRLFEKIHIHADDYTINEIRTLLYEFGRSDVDVLIEGM